MIFVFLIKSAYLSRTSGVSSLFAPFIIRIQLSELLSTKIGAAPLLFVPTPTPVMLIWLFLKLSNCCCPKASLPTIEIKLTFEPRRAAATA